MLARTRTFTIEGLRARPVTVEVDIRAGLPAFTIVGLADAAVREARDRVHAAVLNSGYEFPARRITANLAPADVPKVGPGLDLALACAVLAASGQLPCERLDDHVFYGELSLDGEVRACRGTLAVAQAALTAGIPTLMVAPRRAREAGLVEGLTVTVAERLSTAVRVLRGGPGDPLAPPLDATPRRGGQTSTDDLDLGDLRGQDAAVRAVVIAAAGGHNTILSGPPGTGKTMLAQRLPSILPPLSRREAIEVTRIQSIASEQVRETLVQSRPFRSPHHTITTAGLVGGARRGWVGEIVLAHRGVLFLDELSEFARATLDALRQPLEDGRLAIVRARHSEVYPSRFMLVGATNPCPCGYAGEDERCRCSEAELSRHHRRLSGPLMDRIDILTHLRRPPQGSARRAGQCNSREGREQVLAARELAASRFGADDPVVLNGQMDIATLKRHLHLSGDAQRAIDRTQDERLISARGVQRILRVARTIADIDGSTRTGRVHVAEALCLRQESTRSSRAA